MLPQAETEMLQFTERIYIVTLSLPIYYYLYQEAVTALWYFKEGRNELMSRNL